MGGRAEGIGTLLAGDADDGSAGESSPGARRSPSAPSRRHGSRGIRRVRSSTPRWRGAASCRHIAAPARRASSPSVPPGGRRCRLPSRRRPAGDALIAACWGDGRLVRMSLDAEGRPSQPSVLAAASDPYALVGISQEPRPSRAHHVRFLPRDTMATTDLGLDLVRFWRGTGTRLARRRASAADRAAPQSMASVGAPLRGDRAVERALCAGARRERAVASSPAWRCRRGARRRCRGRARLLA
jgi:hypothetical protein